MSKTVTIPTDGMNPFVVIFNGVKYVYTPGETVEVPDGVALEIEEYKRWREKHPGENVPPFGAQPDWNQNDPNAPGYVKNRTHYERTVTVGGDTLTWDGNAEGRYNVPIASGLSYVKISDAIPTVADLVNGAIIDSTNERLEVPSSSIAEMNGAVVIAEAVIVIHAPGSKIGDFAFEETGIYVVYDGAGYISSITIPGYTGFKTTTTTVKTIDPKYLPDVSELDEKWLASLKAALGI